MQDTGILSTLQAPPPLPGAAPRPVRLLVFDACHVGVVLRAVLFVEAVAAVGAMFLSSGWLDWLGRLALLTGAALPATLAWLVLACASKRWLGRLPDLGQGAAGVALGAVAGLYGCALLHWSGLLAPAPWLAAASAGALVSAVIVAGLFWRARARRPADAAARLAELQARIRPHFLFNALNSAIALVREDPARAEALLEDLSDLFRHALADPAAEVSLAQEIDLARRYLAVEQVRFGDRLRVQWALDAAADAARLPPLLLQPLVENAVRHGVEPSDSGADIRVSTQRRGSTVVIKVSNTVPAGEGLPGHGLALDNVRQRLALLHDVQASLRCGRQGALYQVRIEVPAE